MGEQVESFEGIFGPEPSVAYTGKLKDDITKHRRRFDNQLFFDRLLTAIGVEQASKIYPPHSNKDLRNLYREISSSTSPEHYKHSIIYYVLKDLHLSKHSSSLYAKNAHLPRRYQILIDGLWHLDRTEFEASLEYLTEPCLIPTFPEEILHTLCRHTRTDSTLALAYYYTVSPQIASMNILTAFFTVLCHASIAEAFFFARKQGEATHRLLFEQLVGFVHKLPATGDRAARAIELVGLPLNKDEEEWQEEYLQEGEGSRLPGAKDTLLVRRMAARSDAGTKELVGNTKERAIDGITWTSLAHGVR